MLKIVKNPEFSAQVKVLVPTDRGQVEHSFTARFRALTRSEEAGYNAFDAASTDDFLRKIVVGWDGLQDEDGKPLEFSDEAVSTLIDLHYVRMAIVQAYTTMISGAKNPKRGN
jgi:hypothetical protein